MKTSEVVAMILLMVLVMTAGGVLIGLNGRPPGNPNLLNILKMAGVVIALIDGALIYMAAVAVLTAWLIL